MGERDRRSERAPRDPAPVLGEHIKGRGGTLTYGLFGEGLSILRDPSLGITEIHTRGADLAYKSERDYQGGVLDPMEL